MNPTFIFSEKTQEDSWVKKGHNVREAGLVNRGLRPDPCAVSSIRVQGAVEEVAEVLSPSLLVTTLGQAPQAH